LELFQKENFEMIELKTTVSTSVEEEYEVPADLDATISIADAKNKKRTSAKLTTDDLKQLEKSKSLIKLQIKALIARDLWNMSEYYQIINGENDALQRAIEIIENSKEYDKLLGK
jgi:carboxyl-terminal processing protease